MEKLTKKLHIGSIILAISALLFIFVDKYQDMDTLTQQNAVLQSQVDAFSGYIASTTGRTIYVFNKKKIGSLPYYLRDNSIQSGAMLMRIGIDTNGVNYTMCDKGDFCAKFNVYEDEDGYRNQECETYIHRYPTSTEEDGSSCFNTKVVGSERDIKSYLCM